MRPPPFLVGAGLLFWGWQTDFLLPGALLAVILEGGRWVKLRWDFSDADFTRIWTFCSVLFLAAGVLAFTQNGGPADFSTFFQDPNLATSRNAGNASAHTAAALFRWLPMLFFLFAAAQAYCLREGVPLEAISLIVRWRWKRAKKLGQAPPSSRVINVLYPYFALCLMAASAHGSDNISFFWGLSVLLPWALWPQRARRFGLALWVVTLGAAVGLGYFGQTGLGHLQSYLGNLNPNWLSNWTRRRFDATQSRTELGRIGRVKTSMQIVIRLDTKSGSPPPQRLREATYSTFKGQTWYAELTEQDFLDVHSDTNETTYVLVRGKTNGSSVNLACYLDSGKALLPLPEGTGRLENLMAYRVEKSPLGAVLATGPGLVMFDALYGRGATIDSGGNTNEDLLVPFREQQALDRVLEELHLENESLDHVLPRLARFFQEKFTYRTWQPAHAGRTGETPLTRFLVRTRAGHCEYFATAAVLLLRELNIPARYAVGYAVHEGSGDHYVVRQRDAHAWCLAWDKQAGLWRDFDPTPATWVAAEIPRVSRLQFLADGWSRLLFELSKFRWGQGRVRQYLLWFLAPVLVLLLYQIVFRGPRRRRQGDAPPQPAACWPGLDSEFYQLERKLTERGFFRQSSEPLSEWLGRALNDPALADLRRGLRDLLRLHYRYRFDPQGISHAEREALRREVGQCLARVR
jgi:hypothetical protein